MPPAISWQMNKNLRYDVSFLKQKFEGSMKAFGSNFGKGREGQ